MIDIQNNVKYGKFLVSDVLEKVPTKKLPLHARTLPKEPDNENNIPLIASGTSDQGTVGYTSEKYKPTILENMLTVAANGSAGTTYYQKRKFSILQDAYALKLIDKYKDFINDEVYLYLVATLENRLKHNSWTNKAIWNRVKDYQIELPVTPSGTPDFEYMEERIRELEEERIRELEAYLKVTGLSDATLTDEEQMALDKMNMGGVKQAKFKVGSLFDIQKVRGINKSGLTVPNDNNCYDYVTRTSKDNGVESQTGLVKARELNKAGTYSLGLLQMTFFYRNKPWYAGQFVRKIVPKQKLSQKTMLYFLSIFNKTRPVLLSTLVRHVDDKFTNLEIDLPVTPSGDIDFDFMENYITAIEKQSIRGVIEYKDKVIQTTKNIVNAN